MEFKFDFFNDTLLRRCQKLSFEEVKDNLNTIFEENIRNAISKNKYFSTTQYKISVNNCNLLYCKINVDEKINIEFENGNIITSEIVKDEVFMDNLKIIIKEETSKIFEKLNLSLTLNENISSLGFCFDTNIINKISCIHFEDEEEKEYFEHKSCKPIISVLKELVGSKIKYEPPFPCFPRELLELNSLYDSYCQWLFNLENSPNYDKSTIPMSYKINFKNKKNKELKVITLGNFEDFKNIIINIMKSIEPFTDVDKGDVNCFLRMSGSIDDIPEIIPNLDNLAYIIKFMNNDYNYFDYREKFEKILKNIDINMKNVLILALGFSGHSSKDIGKFKEFKISYKVEGYIMNLLNSCDHRFEEFQKNKYLWVRLIETIYNDNERYNDKYDKQYPELISEFKKILKNNIFNKIFFKNNFKLIINKKDDLNEYFKNNIENSIQKDSYISSSSHHVFVKKCNLLNCILSINNIDIEFENGNHINSNTIEDETLRSVIFSLVEKETEIIRKKLNLALTFNENLSAHGFFMDIDLLKNIVLYDEYEIEELYYIFKCCVNYYKSNFWNERNIIYKDFPREHLSSDLVYPTY
eukprot:jgi/Orpsp1_1/1187469/evm.model.d7180000057942.1